MIRRSQLLAGPRVGPSPATTASSTTDQPADARLIPASEAAERLCIGYSTLREKVARHEIPHVRIGRNILFTETLLAEIIDAHTRAVPLQQVRGSARTKL